jgi:glycosyltransferase involved in cell wall biosynthesis
MRGKIVIVTGASLSWAPRAPKEAAALSEAGFDIAVLGVAGNQARLAADTRKASEGGYQFVAVDDDSNGPVLRAGVRLRAALSSKLFAAIGVATPWLFSPWATSLANRAQALSPNLVIGHLEPGLWVASRMRAAGIPIGIDMEDWYSEDLPPNAQRGRPVHLLRQAEKRLLGCAVHATCTTEAMADALVAEYGCPRPKRIYNVFPAPVIPDPVLLVDRSPAAKSLGGTQSRGTSVRSIHWFSQTIGPGRGLERLFEACVDLNAEFEIHLRGSIGPYGAWIEEVVSTVLRPRVFLHETVANDELPARIAEHDIGYAGEVADIPSRNLTATNKIFQFLQGGLAVVASDTDGQKEVARLAGEGVLLYSSASTEELRRSLDRLIANPAQLAAAKSAAARIAAESLNWSVEKPRLLASIYHVLREK